MKFKALITEPNPRNNGGMRIIRRMARRIAKRFHPEKVILFGSYARGTAGPDSDADLLVVFGSVKNKRRKAAEIYGHLGATGLPKDIVVTSKNEVRKYGEVVGTIIRPAMQEGLTLYERRG